MKGMSLTALGLAVALCAGPAFAKDKDHHDERGRGVQQAQQMQHPPQPSPRGRPPRSRHAPPPRPRHAPPPHRFDSRDHVAVHDYYARSLRGGHCPPGLARKGHACVPRGPARRWTIGRPLPRDVIFYTLPRALVARLRPPPRGYRYVRVANDVLMIAIGTGLVVDAIRDFGAR